MKRQALDVKTPGAFLLTSDESHALLLTVANDKELSTVRGNYAACQSPTDKSVDLSLTHFRRELLTKEVEISGILTDASPQYSAVDFDSWSVLEAVVRQDRCLLSRITHKVLPITGLWMEPHTLSKNKLLVDYTHKRWVCQPPEGKKFRARDTLCFRLRNPIHARITRLHPTPECVGFLGGFL